MGGGCVASLATGKFGPLQPNHESVNNSGKFQSGSGLRRIGQYLRPGPGSSNEETFDAVLMGESGVACVCVRIVFKKRKYSAKIN